MSEPPVECGYCLGIGASPAESFLIHSDPDYARYEVTEQAEQSEAPRSAPTACLTAWSAPAGVIVR